jgi:hypothetical protein
MLKGGEGLRVRVQVNEQLLYGHLQLRKWLGRCPNVSDSPSAPGR